MENKLNINRLMETLSSILSDKYGCKITVRAIPKAPTQQNEQEECKCT